MLNSDSEEEEIVVVSCLLAEEEEQKVKKRKTWIHNINRKRLEFGEFHTLFPDLMEDDVKFFRYVCMTYSKFSHLLNILEMYIAKENTPFRTPVTPKERLAVCLRYLATGNSFRSLAYSFRMGESTVREIVYTTCTAIWTVLKPIVMPVPNQELWIKSEKGFCDKWNFPNAVAAIDGKHVVIQAPLHSGSDYFCYKKQFSTVLLALVDPNYKFLFIDVGGYGKNSDASIFRTSYLGKSLADGSFNLPPPKALPGGNTILPHDIIGDEAFLLSTYLMRPYSRDNVQQDEEKKIFNYRLSRPRNTAENAFGILARKFRIFERRLNVSHEHCVSIVTAACCLHNFLRDDACHWTESDLDLFISNVEGLTNFLGTGGASRQDALEVRDSFKEYFNSEIGSVVWQQRRVRIGQRLT